ncbi:hypothetical protein D210916BOD24_25290 [Alteromonas sp. D210916BOD_24]|uniref:DUF4124 domain-containing protein n=1 Tax=Alteromonas sp. D210916BOD_24 TaxID=3157618 RepID=UPI00399CA3A3
MIKAIYHRPLLMLVAVFVLFHAGYVVHALPQDQSALTLNEHSTQDETPFAETLPSSPPMRKQASKDKTIYKIIGVDGTVTYTDKAVEQAKAVAFDGKTQNVVSAPPPPKITLSPATPSPKYQVAIASPAPEATIRNNSGELTISAYQPAPDKAPTYRLVFDGTPISQNNSGVFQLKGIHRGAHNFKVEITNNTGKTLASSPLQTLYLHQASVLINN